MKKTKTYSAIEDIIAKGHCNPLDYTDILEKLHEKGMHVNKTTVFRILDKMLLQNEIVKLELGEGKYRYEKNINHHHHAVCTVCGRVEKIENCHLQTNDEEIAKKFKFKSLTHRLEFFGVCKSCI